MNSFTLAMDRSEWRVSSNDGLHSAEIDAGILCTAILARNSVSDGETKCPSPYATKKIRLFSPQIMTVNLYIRKMQTEINKCQDINVMKT